MLRPHSSRFSTLVRWAALTGLLLNGSIHPAFSQTATGCTVTTGDAPALLARGLASAGIRELGRPALGLRVVEMVSQDFQSDRSYPPYVQEGRSGTFWYYPDRQLEITLGKALDPFGERPMFAAWSTARGTWMQRDSVWQPVPALHRFTAQTRPLNAWAVLAEWASDPSVRVSGRCVVRDFPRVRLTRTGPLAEERLYLEPSTGLPVQYERTEDDPTRLWGRQAIVYVYSNWVKVGGAQYPMAGFRLVDSQLHIVLTAAPLPADSVAPVPPPSLADTADMRLAALPGGPAPDTVRVSPTTVLLRTRYYTNVITLVRDTIFLLDAQSSEERARQDSTWIATLFPGRHPVVLVVSDFAWPHIAGVRSWVAMGATVVAHRSLREFLTRVVNHRWKETPDLLERRRAQARFRFIAVDDSLTLGGGAVRLYPINGIGSEGALMTWLPGARFLFAGDYVQGLKGPSMAYAAEVMAATVRLGLAPERFAAMHMGLTNWPDLVAALKPASGGVGAP